MRKAMVISVLAAVATMGFVVAGYEATRLPGLRESATAYSRSRPCRPFEDNPRCYQVTAGRIDDRVDERNVSVLVLDTPSGPPVTVDFRRRQVPVISIGEPVDIITWRGKIAEIRDDPRTFHTDAYPETRLRQGYGSVGEYVAIGVGLMLLACGVRRPPGLLAATAALAVAVIQSSTPIMAVTPFVAVTGCACTTALAFAARQLMTTWSARRHSDDTTP